MKRMTALLCLLLLLPGCMPSVRINDRGVVQAIAIDLAEDGLFRLTMQVCELPRKSGGGEESQKPSVVLVEQTASTVAQAIADAAALQGHQMFLGGLQLLIFGEQAAKAGVTPPLSFFLSDHQLSMDVAVAVAHGEAGTLLRDEKEQPALTAEGILDRISSAQKSGYAPESTLLDLAGSIDTKTLSGTAVALEQTEKKELRVAGTAFFQGDRLEGFLDLPESRGLGWLRRELKATMLAVEGDGFGKAAAVTNKVRTRVKADLAADTPVFEISVQVESAVLETALPPGRALSPDDREAVQTLQAREIRREIEKMLEATQMLGSDVCGLSLLVRQKYPDFYLENKERWRQVLMDSGYSVEVACVLNRGGVDKHAT